MPFGRTEDGDHVPLQPLAAPDAEAARRRALATPTMHAGAVAFSHTGDFGDAQFIATSGRADLGPLRG